VTEAAREGGFDPLLLADAAAYVHQIQTEGTRDRLLAIRAARKATGLTAARVGRLLDAGKDYLDLPGFDVQARELAGELPDLGIGIGYDPNGVDEDYGPKLWALLAEPDPVPPAKHSPRTIGQAAAMIGPGERYSGDGPLTFSAARWGDYLATSAFPGLGWQVGRWRWTTTRSARWRNCTRSRSGRCASCVTRSGRCD
jgi:hypothetical protein